MTLTELPEQPKGWSKRLMLHMNFGSKGGSASYSLHDERGRMTNIGYAYDTRGKGKSGFFVNGSELMPWAELRARYAELVKK